MRNVLLKVKDKSVKLNLQKYGEVEVVSGLLNIYAMTLNDKQLNELHNMDGILQIEEDEWFEVQ